MITSELITPAHLARKAIIYVRQSTPHQALSHQESWRLQYALEQRAVSLGWRPDDVVVIDTDLGVTAASAEHRAGFKEVIAQVTLGQVGIILSYDVTRLARNCSDWYPLLDLCGYKRCLIADRDGIYDPGSPNGRLLLGLKGQLSELELHTLRGRLTAGLLNKAERGELALQLPVGLVRDVLGRVVKDPHQEVQDRLGLVFATFLEVRSASKVLQHFNAHDLLLPRRDRFGDIVWKKPTVAALLAILKNPAYAGAFVYGRSRTTVVGPSPVHKTQHRLPMDQWKIRVNDVYPAYVPWETFARIQAMLLDNYAEYDRNKSRGVPRPGKALLHGIVYCGECGHKLVVQYKGRTQYLCTYLRGQYGVSVCERIPADAVDDAVVDAFFEALAPVELDAYAQAVAREETQVTRVAQAQAQHLERLRYEADLAQRQFTRVDPDNRLVAAELERRWEAALSALKQAESAARPRPPALVLPLPPEVRARFEAVGQHLPQLWEDGSIGQAHKKALLRALIDKVVVQRVGRDRVQSRIIWKGGESTTLSVPVTVGSWTHLTGATAMEQSILTESRCGTPDAEIAQQLTAQGYRSPMRAEVLPSTVRNIRLKHRILQKRHQSHPRRVAGYLTVPQLAQALGCTPHWIYDRIYNGTIQVPKHSQRKTFLFPDTPTTLAQLRQLRDGTRTTLAYGREHQDA
jgi:DNA invertase Pin-like site-specific DNA recombinase